jgi:hypothetical protein
MPQFYTLIEEWSTKEDMHAYGDLVGLSRLPDTVWETCPHPRTIAIPRALLPEVELAIYVGNVYALVTASEIVTIMLDHARA